MKGIDDLRKLVLTPEKARELALSMPTRFLCISEEEKDLWKMQPFEYLDIMSQRSSAESLRSPAKDVLKALAIHYRKNFVPELVEVASSELASRMHFFLFF